MADREQPHERLHASALRITGRVGLRLHLAKARRDRRAPSRRTTCGRARRGQACRPDRPRAGAHRARAHRRRRRLSIAADRPSPRVLRRVEADHGPPVGVSSTSFITGERAGQRSPRGEPSEQPRHRLAIAIADEPGRHAIVDERLQRGLVALRARHAARRCVLPGAVVHAPATAPPARRRGRRRAPPGPASATASALDVQ